MDDMVQVCMEHATMLRVVARMVVIAGCILAASNARLDPAILVPVIIICMAETFELWLAELEEING